MKTLNLIVATTLLALLGAGCNPSNPPNQNRAPANKTPAPAGIASNGLPHGGTPVQVGPHDYHLELVNDPMEGKMTAYVLDDHAEKPEAVAPVPFDLIVRSGGNEKRLTFQPVTIASSTNVTSFAASAEWLKTATSFDGEISSITLGGETFQNIKFSYPKGIKHSH